MLGTLFFEGQGGAWLYFLIPALGLGTLILSRLSSWTYPLLAALCLASGLFTFLSLTQSELLFTDDHPSFLFRLMQLKDFFPNIPFYNPLWNSGVEAREFFPSGILNVFILFSPLIYSFDLPSHYNEGVAILLFLVVPACSLLASFLAGYSKREAACACVFALTNSLFWYRWALGYGTLGFILSAALMPIVLVLAARFLDFKAKISVRIVLVTAAALTLMLFWSPAAIALFPLLVYALLYLRPILKSQTRMLIVLLILGINLPWMLIFVQASNVGQAVGIADLHIEETAKFKSLDRKAANLSATEAVLESVLKFSRRLNPALVVAGAFGLSLIGAGILKRVLLLTSVWLLLLGSIGARLMPSLELERMLLVLGVVLILPAARAIVLLTDFTLAWKEKQLWRNVALVLISAPLIGTLCFSPIWIRRVSSNRTPERYRLIGPQLPELVSVIKNNVGQGRGLFAGFVLHEFEGGHIAPLAALTNKPLIASRYQHDRWRYIDVIPEEFRKKGEAGIFEFFDLMNVSLILVHDKSWRKWFDDRPESFQSLGKVSWFKLYKLKRNEAGYFLEGAGQVLEQLGNLVRLRVDTKDAVVKFNYLPFLEVSSCRIGPRKVSESLTFVELTNCNPGQTVELRARGPISRFFSVLSS